MKKIALDTNGFVRYFLNDIPEQAAIVEKLLIQAKERKILLIIPHIVIFEIEFTLNKFYGLSKKEIISSLESLMGMDYLYIQDKSLFKKALKVFKDANISLADSYQLVYTKDKNAELFTFDKQLIKLAKEQ